MAKTDFWLNFNRFITNDYSYNYAKDVFRQAQRYHQCLTTGDLSTLKSMPVEKRRRVMQSLSALAKFNGCYDHYRNLIKAYGLKWSVNNDDIIIARLIKYSGSNGNACTNDLFNWVRKVKNEIPDFQVFMDFTIATGLRFSEAIESYRLIVELAQQGRLYNYNNTDRETLEHFKFKAIFIRRTKKAFMSFVPSDLIKDVKSSEFIPTKDVIERRIRRRGLKLCFSDLRELWASKAVKHLSQPEIDFLQGRVSASVFMQNYFNPIWLTDLKQRALKNAKELLTLRSC